MDDETLSQLSDLASSIHDQHAAKLKNLQVELQRKTESRAELLKRPGSVVDGSVGDSLAWQAQAIWSNSSDAALIAVDADIHDLQVKIDELLATTRESFTKVKGLERLTDQSIDLKTYQRSKREEVSQEALVNLRDQGR